jgi:steroid delta-isomerase-like uncharacterized protein
MNNEIATTEAEANEATTRYWFTEGWLGDYATADKIFSDRFSTNGITVGTEGPKRNIENRLTGFPDLRTFVEEVLAVDDKVVVRLRWTGTHTGPYSGAPATGKPVDVRVISIWRFVDGKVEENWTIQDQFTLFQQVGIVAPDLTTAQVPLHR